MKLNIKKLPDKKEIITTHWISINGIVCNLQETISMLDDLYEGGINRWEYVNWGYITKKEEKLKKLMEELKVIESHSGGSWQSTNFKKFYDEIYKVYWEMMK